MPAKSAKQYKFMQMIAHSKGSNKDNGKGPIGPSEAVAKEFVEKTPKKKRSIFMKKKDKK